MREGRAVEPMFLRLWFGLAGLAVAVVVSIVALAPAPLMLATPGERAPALTQRSWPEHLQLVDEALARGDVSRAVRTWHDAYGAALASRRWDALVATGDAFRRVGSAAGTPEAAKPNARQAYLAALRQAQRQRAVDGVRAVAEAFERLGDREAASYCVRIADRLAGRVSAR